MYKAVSAVQRKERYVAHNQRRMEARWQTTCTSTLVQGKSGREGGGKESQERTTKSLKSWPMGTRLKMFSRCGFQVGMNPSCVSTKVEKLKGRCIRCRGNPLLLLCVGIGWNWTTQVKARIKRTEVFGFHVSRKIKLLYLTPTQIIGYRYSTNYTFNIGMSSPYEWQQMAKPMEERNWWHYSK